MQYLLFSLYLFFMPTTTCVVDENVHEFHLSKCIIDCKDADSTIQVTMHLFIDDLEEALRQQGADKLFLCTEKESKKAEKYMLRYINNHFNLLINKEEVEYNFVGKEISEDLAAVWCYLEIENVNTIESIELKNDILMEVFDDQRNIINLKVNGKDEFLMFDKGNTSQSFNF